MCDWRWTLSSQMALSFPFRGGEEPDSDKRTMEVGSMVMITMAVRSRYPHQARKNYRYRSSTPATPIQPKQRDSGERTMEIELTMATPAEKILAPGPQPPTARHSDPKHRRTRPL